MSAITFSHYNLRAPRELLEQLRKFYCEIVGLRTGGRPLFASFGYWLYGGDKDILHLTESTVGEVRTIEVTTTFDHVAFSCSDLKQYEHKLNQCGIKYEIAHVPQLNQVQYTRCKHCSNHCGYDQSEHSV